MQARYEALFERDMGCTEGDWLRWLPGAVATRPITLGDGRAVVGIDPGVLRLRWQVLPPRRIALATLPRLGVHFEFDGVSAEERHAFMRYFDLYTQRGGG